MRYLIILALTLSACGQRIVTTPVVSSNEGDPQKPFVCKDDGGVMVDVALPNDCGVEGSYCQVSDEIYDSDNVRLYHDSCVYQLLTQQGLVVEHGGW
jgi:hypothetical protein